MSSAKDVEYRNASERCVSEHTSAISVDSHRLCFASAPLVVEKIGSEIHLRGCDTYTYIDIDSIS